jgi:TetR/AcrR family transcriptional regulator, regulator of autoinduction and epiphytic fitness
VQRPVSWTAYKTAGIIDVVPRNRAGVDRDSKIQELLDVAERMFVERGYAETPLAEVASRVGVATNALTWYFPTKDDLFIAVLDRLIDRELGALSVEATSPADLAIQAIAHLQRYRRLITAVHERARASSAVSEFHDRYHHALASRLTRLAIDTGIPVDEAPVAVAVFVAFLEGQLLHDHDDPNEVEASIRYLVERLGLGS